MTKEPIVINSSTTSLEGNALSPPSTPFAEGLSVPIAWRIGQFAVLAIVALLAIYYNTKGYSPGGGAALTTPRTAMDQVGFGVLGLMVWLFTPNAGVIAMTTLQEAIRRRWLLVMLVFGVAVLLGSSFFVGLQPGEEERFLRDFGIGFIITITLLMSIFLGVMLVPPEIERRIIFTILSKPVTRLEFILGKFGGLCLTLALNLAALSSVFLLAYAFFKIKREGYAAAIATIPGSHTSLLYDLSNMINALWLVMGQLVIMAALALCLSLVVSSITSIVFCFIAYFGGQMSSY